MTSGVKNYMYKVDNEHNLKHHDIDKSTLIGPYFQVKFEVLTITNGMQAYNNNFIDNKFSP